MESLNNRRCMICGSTISDDNPDGIGYTCREVWTRARNTSFYHFCGLEVWIAKSNYWANLYFNEYKTTKFRSEFKKGFFKTISKMVEENNVRLSKKMLDIITKDLVGVLPRLKYGAAKIAIDREKDIIDDIRNKWLKDINDEQCDYIKNLAKKFYSEK